MKEQDHGQLQNACVLWALLMNPPSLAVDWRIHLLFLLRHWLRTRVLGTLSTDCGKKGGLRGQHLGAMRTHHKSSIIYDRRCLEVYSPTNVVSRCTTSLLGCCARGCSWYDAPTRVRSSTPRRIKNTSRLFDAERTWQCLALVAGCRIRRFLSLSIRQVAGHADVFLL